MIKIFTIAFLMCILISGYCQCDYNRIVFVDSAMNVMDSTLNRPIYIFNNGKDTLFLDSLYNENLTLNKGPNSVMNNQENTSKFCIFCNRKDVLVIDSIDINKDGLKELFIFREWYCSVIPAHPLIDYHITGGYGTGGQQQYYSKYEVWDVQAKSKILEVNNRAESQISTSISVVRFYGFQFEVNIDEKGNFNLFNPSGNIAMELEMGMYKYDNKTKTYKRE